MQVADLYPLMHDPSLLTQEMVPELRDLIEQYPYFQAVRLLYVKALALTGNTSLTDEIQQMAVFVPDRKRLFCLLEGERYGLDLSPLDVQPAPEDTFSLIDNFLSSVNDDSFKQEDTPLLFQPSVSADYLDWALTDQQAPSAEQEPPVQPTLQHQDLIDSFIQQSAEQEAHPPMEWREEPAADTPPSVKELNDVHPKPLEDSYFTETLARIYVKQKRYEKAMQIIKNLSLKYPEKNVYFADQIRFLEKLIINTKK